MATSKNSKPKGRPTLLTYALMAEIEGRIREGNYIETSVGASGITRQTFYNWLNRGREDAERGKDTIFKEFFETLQIAFDAAEASIVTRINKGEKDWTRLAWLLERTRHARFGQRQIVEMDVGGSPPMEIIPDPPADYPQYLERRQQRILQNQARDADFTELPENKVPDEHRDQR